MLRCRKKRKRRREILLQSGRSVERLTGLKLQTAGVKELEAKYKGSIMELMSFKGGMPPLTVMLDVAHTAMKPWTHKVSAKDMESLYDKYEQEGGDLLSFFTNVYLEVFLVSGFLSKSVAAEMSESLAEMRKEL